MNTIILVSNTSWYLYNFRLGVIRLFQQKKFQIICIANYDEYSEKLIKEGVVFIKSSLANKGLNPFQDINYFTFLLKHYRKIKPCLIFHYTIKPNIYGSVAAKLAGIKSIAIVSGAGYVFHNKNVLNLVTKKLYGLAANASSEVWFVNKEDCAMFVAQKIVKKEKTNILPGEGINTEIFKRDEPYPMNGEKFIFLLAGRMLWDKGVGVYVEAARQIKRRHQNVRFQLLGFVDVLNPSAITKEQIIDWEKEGTVEYLGATDNVKKFLNSINCFVLPSYYREGVPRSLLEAASLEIPIITTDNVGCKEVVEEGYNGFLCLIKNSESLAEKMEEIMNMQRSCLKKLGNNGRKKVIAEFHENLVLWHYEKAISNYIN